MIDLIQLSKTISHALRHEPWLYEVELDAEGWTSVPALLEALRQEREAWAGLTVEDLERAVNQGDKRRHEVDGGRIRAIYGHSVAGKFVQRKCEPPATLYHGTDPKVWPLIQVSGLLPMQRQYVHCSPDLEMAERVGKRKARQPVILHVDAARAWQEGIAFYEGIDLVWLADAIPPQYISRP